MEIGEMDRYPLLCGKTCDGSPWFREVRIGSPFFHMA